MTRCILQRRLAQRVCSCGPSDGGMVPAVSLRLQEISFRQASQHGHRLRGSKPSKEGFLRGGSILRCCRMQRMCSVKDPVTDIGPARPSVLRSGLSSPAWRRRIPLGGAPRIQGELLKVGIDVADRTVSRLLHMLGPEFLAPRSRLFQDGLGLGPAKASGPRHRPTPRRREHGGARG